MDRNPGRYYRNGVEGGLCVLALWYLFLHHSPGSQEPTGAKVKFLPIQLFKMKLK